MYRQLMSGYFRARLVRDMHKEKMRSELGEQLM